jgi:hypothetical protein
VAGWFSVSTALDQQAAVRMTDHNGWLFKLASPIAGRRSPTHDMPGRSTPA